MTERTPLTYRELLSFRSAASDASTRQPRPSTHQPTRPLLSPSHVPYHPVSAIRPETLSKNYEVSCRSRKDRFQGPGAIANTSSQASLPADRNGRSRRRRSRKPGLLQGGHAHVGVAPHGPGWPPLGSPCVVARWACRRRRPAFCSARRMRRCGSRLSPTAAPARLHRRRSSHAEALCRLTPCVRNRHCERRVSPPDDGWSALVSGSPTTDDWAAAYLLADPPTPGYRLDGVSARRQRMPGLPGWCGSLRRRGRRAGSRPSRGGP